MAAILVALPGLASSLYTTIDNDMPDRHTGNVIITSYKSGVPWFSSTTACGPNEDTMAGSWTGVVACSGSFMYGSSWKVTSLWIAEQQRAGVFPVAVFQLSYLTELQVYSNAGMTGFVPDLFGSLPSLTFLALGGNTQLSGALPPSIGSLASLTTLYLASKRAGISTPFTGLVPQSYCALRLYSAAYCSLPRTVACPLPSCATVTLNCSASCVTPSPPPPASGWSSVTASVALTGYTAATFTTALQTAFVAVTAGILGKPPSSLAITSVTTVASRRRRAVLDASVLVALRVTATSASDAAVSGASLSSLSTTQSAAFVAALQAGGLPAASAVAVTVQLPALPPLPPSSLPPPYYSGGGGGSYYNPNPINYNSYDSNVPVPAPSSSSSSSGGAIAGGVVGALFGLGVLRVCLNRCNSNNEQQQR
jgi:hypothetical protein